MTRLAPFILLLTLAACADEPAPTASGTYIASAQREPFHRPSCEWAKKIDAGNRVVYKSRDAAVKAGKRACRVCKP